MELLIKVVLIMIIIEKIIKLVGLVCNILHNIAITNCDETAKTERKLFEITREEKINNNPDLKQFLFIRSEK